ncbi:unnamed protein product [Amoebophrya sp. A25]|nr:unnamed protein product [Amoebophrya sp. A25]|eukprot:GSA25T00002797001.1
MLCDHRQAQAGGPRNAPPGGPHPVPGMNSAKNYSAPLPTSNSSSSYIISLKVNNTIINRRTGGGGGRVVERRRLRTLSEGASSRSSAKGSDLLPLQNSNKHSPMSNSPSRRHEYGETKITGNKRNKKLADGENPTKRRSAEQKNIKKALSCCEWLVLFVTGAVVVFHVVSLSGLGVQRGGKKPFVYDNKEDIFRLSYLTDREAKRGSCAYPDETCIAVFEADPFPEIPNEQKLYSFSSLYGGFVDWEDA